jgi:hypothetical protein
MQFKLYRVQIPVNFFLSIIMDQNNPLIVSWPGFPCRAKNNRTLISSGPCLSSPHFVTFSLRGMNEISMRWGFLSEIGRRARFYMNVGTISVALFFVPSRSIEPAPFSYFFFFFSFHEENVHGEKGVCRILSQFS